MKSRVALSIRTASESIEAVTKNSLARLAATWHDSLALRVQAQELKADTALTYGRGVTKFLTWLANKRPSSNAIREWKAELLAQNVKPSSVNTWLAGLRSFFGWLAEIGEISFDPTQAIKGASRKGTAKKHIRDSLTDREVIRLLEQPDRSTWEGRRDYAMLCVMLYTAARGFELHHADLADLQTIDSALVLHVLGKGHYEKDDRLILPPEAESAVRDWLVMRGNNDGAIFVSRSNHTKGSRLSRSAIRAIIKGHMKTAGIFGRNKTVHSLRHTAITSAIRHGAPVHKVKGMSRHASLDTLMIYYHEADRLSDPAEKYISYSNE